MSSHTRAEKFREVLRPPMWLMFLYSFLFGSFVLAIWAAFDARATYISLLAAGIGLTWIWRSSPLHIRIDDELRVARAHLELQHIADVEVLSGDQMRLLRTRDADPAAFLALRFWCPTGVKVVLQDSRDLTPYWLITSKHGERLKAALGK